MSDDPGKIAKEFMIKMPIAIGLMALAALAGAGLYCLVAHMP